MIVLKDQLTFKKFKDNFDEMLAETNPKLVHLLILHIYLKTYSHII